jgi:hypothetical protein
LLPPRERTTKRVNCCDSLECRLGNNDLGEYRWLELRPLRKKQRKRNLPCAITVAASAVGALEVF